MRRVLSIFPARQCAGLDRLLLVSGSSEAGLRAAQRIVCLVKELEIEIKNAQLILNRTSEIVLQDRIKDLGVEIIGIIPEDDMVLAFKPLRQGHNRLR